jgi:hypothetical protein
VSSLVILATSAGSVTLAASAAAICTLAVAVRHGRHTVEITKNEWGGTAAQDIERVVVTHMLQAGLSQETADGTVSDILSDLAPDFKTRAESVRTGPLPSRPGKDGGTEESKLPPEPRPRT